MAKEEKVEKTTLTVGDGIRFGLGFFLVSMTGLAAIIAVMCLAILAFRYIGLNF